MSKIKEQLGEIKAKLAEFVPIMDGLSRARNPFELRYFVIGKHDDRVQQYKQAVIEMDTKYKTCIEGEHNRKVRALERERWVLSTVATPKNRLDEIENEEAQLEIEKLDREEKDALIGMTGAFKEVMDFITIIENEYSDLMDKTEEELLKTEVEHWKKRFAKQIHVDMASHGRIGEGNRSSLEMMPKDVQAEILQGAMLRSHEYTAFEDKIARETQITLAESYPRPTAYLAPPDYTVLKLRKDAPPGYPEDRIVNVDRAEIMLATMHRPGDTKWFSEEFYIPTGKNYVKHWITCPNGDSIGEYRNRLVKDALSLGCTHIFFVDDDLVVDKGALQKLYAHDLDVVGFAYPKKQPVIECASMMSMPGSESKQPVPLDSKGLVEADWALTGGGTLIKMDVFKRIPYPWYLTTPQGTEDVYLTARLNEVGIKSWIDCDLWASHIDKSNGDSYERTGIYPGKYKHLI